jgi:hypothetical protein
MNHPENLPPAWSEFQLRDLFLYTCDVISRLANRQRAMMKKPKKADTVTDGTQKADKNNEGGRDLESSLVHDVDRMSECGVSPSRDLLLRMGSPELLLWNPVQTTKIPASIETRDGYHLKCGDDFTPYRWQEVSAKDLHMLLGKNQAQFVELPTIFLLILQKGRPKGSDKGWKEMHSAPFVRYFDGSTPREVCQKHCRPINENELDELTSFICDNHPLTLDKSARRCWSLPGISPSKNWSSRSRRLTRSASSCRSGKHWSPFLLDDLGLSFFETTQTFVQPPHLDYSWSSMAQDGCEVPYSLFVCVSGTCSKLLVWRSHTEGIVVNLRYGEGLYLRGDVVHAECLGNSHCVFFLHTHVLQLTEEHELKTKNGLPFEKCYRLFDNKKGLDQIDTSFRSERK